MLHAQHHSRTQQLLAGIALVVICFTAAAIGGLVTEPQIPEWYQGLAKPDWNPPDWVFGPVWSILYLSMAVAAWLVWREAGFKNAGLPFALFATQLVLNSLWSVIFFGLQSPGAAAVEIVLLWLAILATMLSFWRVSKWAGALFVPYLAWVSFAVVLNFSIWQMNA